MKKDKSHWIAIIGGLSITWLFTNCSDPLEFPATPPTKQYMICGVGSMTGCNKTSKYEWVMPNSMTPISCVEYNIDDDPNRRTIQCGSFTIE